MLVRAGSLKTAATSERGGIRAGPDIASGGHERQPLRSAWQLALEEEAARARYLKTYYNADINDPQHYDLIINTSRVGYENTACLIGEAVRRLT